MIIDSEISLLFGEGWAVFTIKTPNVHSISWISFIAVVVWQVTPMMERGIAHVVALIKHIFVFDEIYNNLVLLLTVNIF